mmetsp:Transcript_18577/g.47033  ORF Transcript_18577/g.47033 Transcript_18577/m.47033 type:complete len:602 (-) Transcript_18577:2406-4211(-)
MDLNESCSGGEDDYNSEAEEQGMVWDPMAMDGSLQFGPGGGYGRARRAAWTSDEERRLAQLAARYSNAGQRMCWRIIAQELNTGRTSKQCREHYLNSLRPNMKKGGWTQREEYIISREHSRIGSHWCIIAKKLPGRTDNSIKNFFNATVRSKAINKTESILWLYVDRLRNGRQPKDAFVEACEVWSAYMPQSVVQEVMHGKSTKPGSQGSGQSSGLHISTNTPMLPRSGSYSNMGRGSGSPRSNGLQAGMLMPMLPGMTGMPVHEGAADDGAEALMLLAGKCVPDEAGEGAAAGAAPVGGPGPNGLHTRASRTSSGTDYNGKGEGVKAEPGAQRQEQEAEQGEGMQQPKRRKLADLATAQQLLAAGAPSLMQVPGPGSGLQGLPLGLGAPGLSNHLLGGGLSLETLQQLQLQQLLAGGAGAPNMGGGAGGLPLQSLLQQLGAQQLLQQQLQLNSALGAQAGLLPPEQLLAAQNAGLQQQLLHNASILQALDANKQGGAGAAGMLPQLNAAGLQQLGNPAAAAALQQQLSNLQAAGGMPGQQQLIIITVPAGSGLPSGATSLQGLQGQLTQGQLAQLGGMLPNGAGLGAPNAQLPAPNGVAA